MRTGGSHLDHRDPEMLLHLVTRVFKFLPESNGRHFLRA